MHLTKEQLDAKIDSLQDELIADIQTLVGIGSRSGDKAGCDAALRFVLGRAADFGLRTFTTTQYDVGVVELGGGDGAMLMADTSHSEVEPGPCANGPSGGATAVSPPPQAVGAAGELQAERAKEPLRAAGQETIGVLAHVDVVDYGDLARWTSPPTVCEERGGFLYGRGTEDDKGPVMMSLYALRALRELGAPLDRKIWLIVGTGEESEWTDIEHFRQQFPLPDYGFTPDGGFPVYNGENGYVDVRLRFEEPEIERLALLCAGESPNTIPSLAQVRMAGGEIKNYHGTAGHSSMPELADNAIERLCREDAALADFNFARFVNHFFGGGAAPDAENTPPSRLLGFDDGTGLWNGEAVGPSTVAATVLGLENGAVALNLNIRQRWGVEKADLQRAFEALAAPWHFTYTLADYHAPLRIPADSPPLRLMDAVQREYGIAGGFATAAGTTYAKAMPGIVGWGPLMPNDTGTAHVEDERLSLADMLLATKVYARFLARAAVQRNAAP